MTTKAVMTRRGGAPLEVAAAMEASEAGDLGIAVESRLPYGTLISGSDSQYSELESRGFRVKVLPDTNVMEIGTYQIDTESEPPKVPARLDVAKTQEASWPHHLVQLTAPPNEEWVRTMEEQGVDVVEPISSYGLFVAGDAERVQALQNLPFVEWIGPFKPAYRVAKNVEGLKGLIQYLSIGVYPSSAVENVKAALANLQATIVREERMAAPYGGEFAVLITEVDAKHTTTLASLPDVRWLEFQPPMEPVGERETQIVAENLDGTASPVTGYQAWLAGVSLSGTGVTVAICDTGIDSNASNNVNGHTDLRGRQAAFVDYTAGAALTDTNGHGTNVAGIAVGNAATGQAEAAAPANFLWGQGIAPQASYVTQNFLLAVPQPSTATLFQDAAANGAQVMNNSWGVDSSGGLGYGAGSRTIDLAVRDPNAAAPGLQNMAVVCAAGNAGGRNSSIGSPHESKNDIVVGNSLTSRPGRFPSDNVRGVAGTSSRGPAIDGRILPTVVAPGTDVSSAHSRTATIVPPIAGTGTPDPANPANLVDQYNFMTGTSQASPHVAGTCALLVEWWRDRTGRAPSPAMLKALLVNGAEDLAGGENWHCLNRVSVDKSAWSLHSGSIFRRNMTFVPVALVEGNTVLTEVASLANLIAAGQWFFEAGTSRLFVRMTANTNPANNVPFLTARDAQPMPAIPNGHQGWGRVSLPNIISQHPASDRGPKLFSDQRHAFTANGQEHVIRVAPVDTARPLRITVAWTDAAGAVNANPALVNDLDLEVIELATGDVYRGNVFVNGFSTTGGVFDNRNNVECVYIQAPAGTYEISIIAANIAASARPDIATPWQDFALVIDNAEAAEAAPISVVPVIDRSGSMVSAGYVDVTRTSSKQFVDLLGVDDRLGVVSFGSTSTIEYPTGPAPALQTIAGQAQKDDANAQVDGIAFGGCTFMGAGINEGRDLLNPAAGVRAMVLLSDGYDNKGCDVGNAAKPSALQAVTGLPAGMPVYTCAMGPASDQSLLDQIATVSGGRYYYMPTIDDLFEIYNYIRGQITGDSIVANASATASSSRIGAFVDALATEATFNVAWADERLRYVSGEPRRADEVSVRLRSPRGELLHPDCSYMRRIIGRGYVAFKFDEPEPGQWYVEVSTAGDTHVRYTLGAFVKSPLRLHASVRPNHFIIGTTFNIATKVFDGKVPVTGSRATAHVVAPTTGIAGLLKKFKTQLRDIPPLKAPGGDVFPGDIGKLLALRTKLLTSTKRDILAHITRPVTLRSATADDLNRLCFTDWIPDLVRPAVAATADGPMLPIRNAAGWALPGLLLGGAAVLAGAFRDTAEAGSYNVAVTVNGSARGGTRFVRKDLVSVVIR